MEKLWFLFIGFYLQSHFVPKASLYMNHPSCVDCRSVNIYIYICVFMCVCVWIGKGLQYFVLWHKMRFYLVDRDEILVSLIDISASTAFQKPPTFLGSKVK